MGIGSRIAVSARAAVPWLGAALLGILGGCVGPEPEETRERVGLGAGHLVIQIGRSASPQDDRVLRADGVEEPLWSTQAAVSAATALVMFVKDVDPEALDESDFVEIHPTRDGQPATELVVLERPREKDASFRLFQVQLFRHGDLWVPEVIVICQGDPGRRKGSRYY